jgi:hypothetical protein
LWAYTEFPDPVLDQLKEELGQEHFAFCEGSKIIANLVPGRFDAFQKLEEQVFSKAV